MTVDPKAAPVMLNVAVVLPALIATAGGVVTIPVGTDDSETVIPFVGAGALRVMVPFIVCVNASVCESTFRVMTGVATFTVAVPGKRGAPNAVIVVLPTPTGVMVTFAPELPWGTFTFGGAVAAFVLLLVKLMSWPPWPAGADRVTVRVPPAFVARFSGLGVSVMVGAAAAIMFTVAGLLGANRSLTINCTT